MKVCGLTGGVGMGKSTAAGFLLAQGVRVVDTDDLAHQLVQPGQPALAEITQTFGAERVTESPVIMGSEDFAYYARAVPACFALLGAGDAAHAFPNHHPAFDFDEAAMSTGIGMHVAIAEHALHELR